MWAPSGHDSVWDDIVPLDQGELQQVASAADLFSVPPLPGSLMRTRLCRDWIEKRECRSGASCTFAHDPDVADAAIAQAKADGIWDRRQALAASNQLDHDVVKWEEAEAGSLSAGDSRGISYSPLDDSNIEFAENAGGTKIFVVPNKRVVIGRVRQVLGGEVKFVQCVVKQLAPGVTSRELEINKSLLDSPETKMRYVCKLIDFHQRATVLGGSDFFVALEHCDTTLAAAVRPDFRGCGERWPSLAQRSRWCCEMADGLQALHGTHPAIVHRDLKPSKVLLKKAATGEFTVKLADFGCSRELEQTDETLNAVTNAGTINWQARELLVRGDKFAKMRWHQADIFSLGCVFFHTLVCQHNPAGPGAFATHPFGREDMIEQNIRKSAWPSAIDLERSWRGVHGAATADNVAARNGTNANLFDAWRLIRAMVNHDSSQRPSVHDVCDRLESEGQQRKGRGQGLEDHRRRINLITHCKQVFFRRGAQVAGDSLRQFNVSESLATGRQDWKLQWPEKSRVIFDWPSKLSNDWTVAFGSEEDRDRMRTGWCHNLRYDCCSPHQILRLARNIIQHASEQTDAGAKASLDEVRADDGTVDLLKYQQAVADYFCCKFPALIDCLWEGLPDSASLAS